MPIAAPKKLPPPTLPGEMLADEWLEPMEMTQSALAAKLGVHVQVVNAIVRGRRAITPKMAIKLGEVLGTSAQFWLNVQNHWDLWHAQRELAKERAKRRKARAA